MTYQRMFAALAVSLVGCAPLLRPAAVALPPDDVAPIERLGRWDGQTFVPVEEGSVDPTRVHVIVHGWAPGWARDGAVPSKPAWSAELDGRPFDPWMRELASALAERDPHAAVFVYSWLDHAATTSNPMSQRLAYSRTDRHGHKMSEAIEAAISDRFREGGGQIHLIGHSFGARVATIAATRLESPPRHLTLLDAPDSGLMSLFSPTAELPMLLRQLPIGPNPGETFVDNYISAMGTTYRFQAGLGAVVDVVTTPPAGAFDLRPRHAWAAEFYARTADEGFGIGWSPLLAGTPPRGCFSRPYDRMDLVPRCEL